MSGLALAQERTSSIKTGSPDSQRKRILAMVSRCSRSWGLNLLPSIRDCDWTAFLACCMAISRILMRRRMVCVSAAPSDSSREFSPIAAGDILSPFDSLLCCEVDGSCSCSGATMVVASTMPDASIDKSGLWIFSAAQKQVGDL